MDFKSAQSRFLFLDELRGVAALGVVLFHCYNLLSLHLLTPLPRIVDLFFSLGHFGVQVFFVLSGFVIAYSTREAKFDFSFLKDFVIRRSIRLDPPYWITLLGLISLSVLGSLLFSKEVVYPLSLKEILANLFYIQYLLDIPSILPVAWTLCIELQLYLALTLLLILCSTLNRWKGHSKSVFQSKTFLIFSGFFALFCWSIHLNFLTIFSTMPKSSLCFNFWHQFFLGSLVCWILYKNFSLLYFFAYILILSIPLFFNFNGEDFAALATSLLIFVVGKSNKMYTLLTSSFIQWCGKISYSLYITHWMTGIKFLDIVNERILSDKLDLFSASLLFVCAFLMILYSAHLFYKWVEEPSLRFSRNWKQKKSAVA